VRPAFVSHERQPPKLLLEDAAPRADRRLTDIEPLSSSDEVAGRNDLKKRSGEFVSIFYLHKICTQTSIKFVCRHLCVDEMFELRRQVLREESMSEKFDGRDFLRVGGISPPPISHRVPAQRVLSVEAVMDVERAILWPDSGGEQPVTNDNVEVARAQEGEGRRIRR